MMTSFMKRLENFYVMQWAVLCCLYDPKVQGLESNNRKKCTAPLNERNCAEEQRGLRAGGGQLVAAC